MEDSIKMQNVFEHAIKELEEVFQGKKVVTDITKMAASSISVYSRLRATELHEHVLKYQVCKDLSKNKEELHKFIKTSLPIVNPVQKALK